MSDGWRLITSTLRDQWKGLTLGVTVGLIWTAGKVSVPFLVQRGIDRGIEAGDLSAVRHWATLIGVAGLVAGTFTGLRRYMAFREARWAEARLRDRFFAHVQRLHFAYHDRTQTGELMSRGNTDLQQLQNFVVLLPLTISNAVTVISVAVVLFLTDPVLTVVALGPLPLVNFFGRRFSMRLHPWVRGVQEESAQLASVVEESVAGVRVVKGFGAEDVQRSRLATEADDVYDQSIGAARTRAVYLPALELIPNLGLIAVLGVGGHRVIAGDLLLGQFVQFNLYVVLLVWPLRMLGTIIAQAQRAEASAARVQEVLATAPAIDHDPRAPRLPDGPGEVRFEEVRFAYPEGDGTPVLDGFDLIIPAGTSVALVGATGSGKSTVAKLVPRFYDPDAGAVRIDGADLREVRLADVRRAVGIVFEDTFLFADTVAANIAFADPDVDLERIEWAARLAGAHEFVCSLPRGYDTELGERGFSLSGGQRQRIAIARAILADPRVLILDDATSSVDPTKEHEIRDALAEVMTDRTTIVVAHRAATIALADSVVLIDDGKVAATGRHDELLADDDRYRRVLAASDAEAGMAAPAAGGGR